MYRVLTTRRAANKQLSSWLRTGILQKNYRCPLSFLGPGRSGPLAPAVSITKKQDLDQILDTLRKEDNISFTSICTIQNILRGKIQAEVYCDKWPEFSAIAVRIAPPTLMDVVLYASNFHKALELLDDERVLRCPGSHVSGGVVFAEMPRCLGKHISTFNRRIISEEGAEGTIMQYRNSEFPESDRPDVPNGYIFGSLKPEHAQFISDHWRFSKYTKNAPQAFEFLIQNFPHSAIFAESNNTEPVAWVLSYPTGQGGHGMVLEDHRCQNIFKSLTNDLIGKMQKEGYPLEFVSDNKHVIRFAKGLGFSELSETERLVYNPKAKD